MNNQVIANGQWFIDQLNLYQSANSDYLSIKNNFIVRLNEFEIIISSLKSKDVNDPLQNELILGRRGSGKSTLLKRIEIEITEDKELNSKYIPVNLAEEQAGIYRLFDLWEEVLKEMSHQLGIQFSLKDFSFFKQEQDYTRYLYQSIHETAMSQNKKIVLLLDNFDRIVENFTDDGNLLRETLINFNDLVIIAGSTRMDEHFWGYDMPFYDFFRKHRLEALNKEELYRLLNHWSEALNIPQLKEFIANNPGKIENIRLLTDGLPRTIQFFIQMVLQDAHSHSYDYLKKIMDNVTPLYQERLNHQTPQLRKIILEMAFIWEACNTKQLVEKCKMESKLISANLKTLVDRGIVDKIETSKKNHLYRISERFFNMWLIITQGNPEQKRKAKWLSIFLENWYDAADLKLLARSHIKLLQDKRLDQRGAILLSKGLSQCKYITVNERDEIIVLTEKLDISAESNILMLPATYVKIYNRIADLMNHQEFNTALELAYSIENEEDGNKFLLLGRIYFAMNKYPEALKNLKCAKQKGNTQALHYLGLSNLIINEYAEAEKYFLLAIKKGVVESFYCIGLLYVAIDKFTEAEKYFLIAIEKGFTNAMYHLAMLYGFQKKYLEAEKCYLVLIEKGNEKAMYNLALLYDNQKKYLEAERYYLMAIDKGVEKAITSLALLYITMEKYIEAEKYLLISFEKGVKEVALGLALLYSVQEKHHEAEKYFLMAIENGDESAIYNFAVINDYLKKYPEAEKYYLMAIKKGNDDALSHLAVLNYRLNKNKEKSLDLCKRASFTKHNIANQKNLLIAEIWNGIFNDTEERTKSIVRENSDELYEFIIDLFIHQQKVLVMKLFNNEDFGKILQEKYNVLYYACLWLNNKTDENLDLRIPPEIRTTVDEVLAEIDKKERFYGYK